MASLNGTPQRVRTPSLSTPNARGEAMDVEVEGAKPQSALAHDESIAATNHSIEVALRPLVNLQPPSLPPFPPE